MKSVAIKFSREKNKVSMHTSRAIEAEVSMHTNTARYILCRDRREQREKGRKREAEMERKSEKGMR